MKQLISDIIALAFAGIFGGIAFLVLGGLAAGWIGLAAGAIALPFWIVGGVVLGGPLWLSARHAWRASAKTATLCGATLAGIAAPVTAGTVLSLPPVFDENFVQFVALISSGSFLAGAVAGFALWKLAYREPRRSSKGSVSEAPEP